MAPGKMNTEGIATKQDIIDLMGHIDMKFDSHAKNTNDEFKTVHTRITNVQVKQSGISAVVSLIVTGVVIGVTNIFKKG